MGVTAVIVSQIALFFLGVFILQITNKNQKRSFSDDSREITLGKKVKHVVTLIINKDKTTV
jgi:uncharacterized membrane protein YkvI